jgi:hypothetical protein
MREPKLRRRVERLAAVQVEARQVQRAGERISGQEALVELEILVRADALGSADVTVEVDQQDLDAVDLDHQHRAI